MKKLHILLTGLALLGLVAVGFSATKSSSKAAKVPDCCTGGSCCDGGSCCH